LSLKKKPATKKVLDTPLKAQGKPAKASTSKKETSPKDTKQSKERMLLKQPTGKAIKLRPVKTVESPGVKKPSAKKAPVSKNVASPKPSVKTGVKKQTVGEPAVVEFRLKFHTHFGQSLFLVGDHPLLGAMDFTNAIAMEYLDTEHWGVKLDLARFNTEVKYQYVLKHIDGRLEYDWGFKKFDPSGYTSKDVLVIDSWNHAGYYENAFYTEPFRDVLLEQAALSNKKPVNYFTHRFVVKAPLLKKGEALCLLGHGDLLKGWDTLSPIIMDKKSGEDSWSINLDLSTAYYIEYKYGVYDTIQKQFVRYEAGPNRVAIKARDRQQVCVNDGFAMLPNDTWKGAGLAIPVFSLRTNRSFGVGEFTDLKLLVDWAKKVGMKMIQLLPVNDTTATDTWTDSYTYAAISAFALHPIFLDLEKITDPKNRHLLTQLEKKRQELNAATTVQYPDVIEEKRRYIQQIFPLQKAATFKKKDFKDFFKANEHWLVPYAVFCYLKDEYGTSDFNQWPAHNQYVQEEVNALAKESAIHDKVNIHFFVQYHLHLQLKEATAYAHANQVIVKGDIPIGIYRYGADAWQHPELYHMDVQAGAPPDDFAVKGQNWGFPTYNWETMKQDGFKWWRQRFEQMSYYFDAFRIDHILGFFRIWSIPLDAVEGIMGYFVPAVAVDVNEFAQRGIPFDYNRYCRPFITESILHEIFGERSAEVKETFLVESGFEQYALQDEFNTQRKVERYFAGGDYKSLQQGLFDLISNVILFEEAGSKGSRFHFRFAMEDTFSFRELDGHTKYLLKQLYLNYFFERQDDHWRVEAMEKLPGLKRSTNMLVCGEDLGLVPRCVPDVMQQLGILSLEIQRMPKAVNKQFFHPAQAPYLSVVTPSTHDMSTIRAWWEEDRSNTQKFYNNELRQPGEAPFECEPWISKAIILQHLHSPAMWSVFQLQDLLGMSSELRRKDPAEERINLPSNPQHYWNYRMHIGVEELLGSDQFNEELKEYIQTSGR
jgi:4-alpha-glucanotransferase